MGEASASTPHQKEAPNAKRYAYNNNYKGKHPMTKHTMAQVSTPEKGKCLKRNHQRWQ